MEFPQERQVWGKLTSLVLANLNNTGKFRAIGVLPSCPAPCPEKTVVKEHCLVGCMSQRGEDGSEMVSMHIEGTLLVQSVRINYPMEGQFLPSQKCFKCQVS